MMGWVDETGGHGLFVWNSEMISGGVLDPPECCGDFLLLSDLVQFVPSFGLKWP